MPESPAPDVPELQAGENCWRRSRVGQGAFLLSTRDYFRAFREAVRAAEREVVILAWDIADSIEMVRTEDDDGYPSKLADFLIAVLEEKPDLVVRILLWDYSVLYLTERDWLPFTRWRNPGHPRLELVTDDAIDAGASHHQKLVVVDGRLAFCGGIDLAAWRWDTRAHRAGDERRRSPDGEAYQPYHDVQVALCGAVVDDLRELAAMRWERATGGALPALGGVSDGACWPESVAVDFSDEEVALALTFARYEDKPPSRHIERLHLETIARARRFLYIENQYLSSHAIVEALCERLREPDGPEVVLVLTREAGWAEEGTLGVLRDRLLEILDEADVHGRLSACYPHAEGDPDGGEDSQVYVHAKLLVADDRILLLGSANLSNRSMRVDSELDLGFVHAEPRDFIRRLREELLAMHVHESPERIREEVDRAGSLRGAIESLREAGGNRLRVLEPPPLSDVQRRLADTQLLDPDEPISPVHHAWKALHGQAAIFDEPEDLPSGLRWLKIAGWVAGLVVAGLALSQLWLAYLDQESVTAFLGPLRDSPHALLLLLLVFVAAGVLAVPINLILIGSVLTFGPWQAFACGLAGSLIAAGISFGIGHHFGKPLIRRIAGDRLDSLSASLKNRGIWSVAFLRVLPIAPFGLMNLVAGVSGLRFAVFMIGSAIGLVPGVAVVVLATRQFVVALRNPGWDTWLVFIAIAAVVGGLLVWVRRRFT